MRAFGDYKTSNTLIMGVLHAPMRSLAKMTGGAITLKQLDGLIMMFNGHFFKGLHQFNKNKQRKEKKGKKNGRD